MATVAATAATGCFSSELLRLPGDLLTPNRHYTVTRIANPGPMEQRLYAAADRTGLQRVIADTRNPAYDPKRIARRCDAGEAAACTQTARLFAFALDEAPLALKIWQTACDRGDPDSCMRIADALSTGCRLPADLARAHAMYRHVCETFDRPGRACRHAVELLIPDEHERWPPRTVPRPAVVFPMLDLACRRGDELSCTILFEEFVSPYGEFAVNGILATFYDQKRRQLAGHAPPPPGAVEKGDAAVDAERDRVEQAAVRREIGSILRFVPGLHLVRSVIRPSGPPRPGDPLGEFRLEPERDLAPLPSLRTCLSSCPDVIPTDGKEGVAVASCFCRCLLKQNVPVANRRAVEMCSAKGTSDPSADLLAHPNPERARAHP